MHRLAINHIHVRSQQLARVNPGLCSKTTGKISELLQINRVLNSDLMLSLLTKTGPVQDRLNHPAMMRMLPVVQNLSSALDRQRRKTAQYLSARLINGVQNRL